MKTALALAWLGEAATGLGLLVVPSLVGQLLLGSELQGSAVVVARVSGIALIGLALACGLARPWMGMLFYVAAVALYLGYLGLVGEATGVLLRPAVLLHVVLAALLARSATQASASTNK
jgi:hypothetical protein